jgi:lysyl-tRNA synthetase class 2
MNVGKLKEFLFEELVEEKLINPTFITNYPIEISPLARKNDENPNIADRFELFIGKKEYANGFSELNDPKDQYDRFKKQLDEKAKGDVEAMEMDPSFITSLSYGMTSAGGCGLGIDRLTMLMGNMGTIKQAIAFPATKTQAKIDLTIGEKDRVKKDIEEIVKEVLDIIQVKEELSSLKNYLRKKAEAINNEDIEALKNVLEDLVDLKESIK